MVICLSADVSADTIHGLLSAACGEATLYEAVNTAVCSALKQRFTFVYPPTSDLYAVLDVAKVRGT